MKPEAHVEFNELQPHMMTGMDNMSEATSMETNTQVRGWSIFNISIEPLFFSVVFATTFSQGVMLNLLERNVCMQEYNLTLSECNPMNYMNHSMKAHLEGTAAQVNLAIQLIQGLCPVAMSLFVGPWSDSNGRKPFIMLPFAGYFLFYLLWGFISWFPHVPIKYLLIPSLPLSLTGGLVSLLVCSYCYLCDIFDHENRTFRFNVAVSALLGGGLLANVTVTRIFNAAGENGYSVVFFISSAVSAFAFLYSWLCLEEPIKKGNWRSFLFKLEYAKSVVSAVIMRPLSELTVIILTVAILVSEMLLKTGESAIEYLVGKSQFSWSLREYTFFSTCNTIIAVLSSVLGSLILKRVMKLENATIIIIGGMVLTVSEIIRGLSEGERMYWTSSAFTKTSSLIGPTIAAEMSNVVKSDDFGKVYAFNALVESGSAYMSIPIYTALYRKTLVQDDSIHVYFLSAAISTVIIMAAVCLCYNNKRNNVDDYTVNKF